MSKSFWKFDRQQLTLQPFDLQTLYPVTVWKDLNHLLSMYISISRGWQHFKGIFRPPEVTSFLKCLLAKGTVCFALNCMFQIEINILFWLTILIWHRLVGVVFILHGRFQNIFLQNDWEQLHEFLMSKRTDLEIRSQFVLLPWEC